MIPVRYTQQDFEKLSREGHFGQPAVDVLDTNAEKYPDNQVHIYNRRNFRYRCLLQCQEVEDCPSRCCDAPDYTVFDAIAIDIQIVLRDKIRPEDDLRQELG